MKKRFWELDALRGIAILAMVLFHALFDLKFFVRFDLLPIELWYWLPRLIGGMFIFLVGTSMTLSKSKPFKRGAVIFSWGMVITAVTWALFPKEAIFFGILHFIGAGIILAQPFMRKNTLLAAVFSLGFGAVLQGMRFDFSQLFWLGFQPAVFRTFDYYPLLPWFGILLLGVYAGQQLYRKGKRTFTLPNYSKSQIVKLLEWLGKHSLIIYLIHQPLLLAVIASLGLLPI